MGFWHDRSSAVLSFWFARLVDELPLAASLVWLPCCLSCPVHLRLSLNLERNQLTNLRNRHRVCLFFRFFSFLFLDRMDLDWRLPFFFFGSYIPVAPFVFFAVGERALSLAPSLLIDNGQPLTLV